MDNDNLLSIWFSLSAAAGLVFFMSGNPLMLYLLMPFTLVLIGFAYFTNGKKPANSFVSEEDEAEGNVTNLNDLPVRSDGSVVLSTYSEGNADYQVVLNHDGTVSKWPVVKS